MFFLLFASLIFLYFSLIFLAASCAFLPGCKLAVVSRSFIVSSLSLISSFSGSVSSKTGGGLLYGFLLAKFLYFLTIFLATSCVAVVPLVFFKSIMSPTGSVGRLLIFSLFLLFFGTLKMYCIES